MMPLFLLISKSYGLFIEEVYCYTAALQAKFGEANRSSPQVNAAEQGVYEFMEYRFTASQYNI